MPDPNNEKYKFWKRQLRMVKGVPENKRIWHPHEAGVKLAIVLIEFRKHDLIHAVLRNVAHIYGGTDTSLVIMHGTTNKNYIKKRVGHWDNVDYIELPHKNVDRFGYSKVLTEPSFWERLHSDYVLIIQTDTVTLQPLAPIFYDYDYVGAPWPQLNKERSKYRVGNGGYSLRRVSTMLSICQEHQYNEKNDIAEDVFFSKHMSEEKIAPFAIGKVFAVECVFYPVPCGSHKGWAYNSMEQVRRLLRPLKKFHVNKNKKKKKKK